VLPGGAALATGVAVGPTSIVAVGNGPCVWNSERESGRCWGQAWTSADGVAWTAADPRTAGLELGISRPVLSRPEIGLDGVAYGPAGFLAFGRVGEKGGQLSAVWRSDDGSTWQRVTAPDTFPTATRLRTILGAHDRYLLGGVIYYDSAPRAAVWSSADGITWTRARAPEAFGIGGYIDTMEDAASGGINAFALYPGPTDGSGRLADGVVAVGQACMPSFDKDPWAWSGWCWGQLWRSPDGLAWTRDEGDMLRPRGEIGSVAAVGRRFVIDAPICFEACGSALLLSPDGSAWQVAYGSPVGGKLWAMTTEGGHFYALVAVPATLPEGPAGLSLWASGDGTNWALEQSQPTMPLGPMWLGNVDMAVFGDRLVVIASALEGVDVPGGSIALLSPPLP
jgi:hypothetical protein